MSSSLPQVQFQNAVAAGWVVGLLVRLGFVAAPRGEIGDVADRGVAGMNAIAFARNFSPACQKPRQNDVSCWSDSVF